MALFGEVDPTLSLLCGVAHVHSGLKEAALELEAPPELANVGLRRGKVIECGKKEGVGAGVGDGGPAYKGDEVLVKKDEAGD